MRRLLTVLALVAGVATPPTGASPAFAEEPPPPAPGVGIRLVDVPLATADDSRARAYIIDRVTPGTVIRRRIEVSNGTGSTAKVSLYPAAAAIRGGGFSGAEDRTQNEVSTWVTIAPAARNVAPGGREMAQVTIRVPDLATRGEHYGVVWAQTTTPATDGGVTRVNRVGIRLYLFVGRGGAPPVDFAVTALTAARNTRGVPLVHATVRNTGERAVDLSAKLRLFDGPGGLSAGPFRSDLKTTLAPGQTVPVTVALDRELPAGPWKTVVTASSGLEERRARGTTTFPRSGAGRAVQTQTDVEVPWWVIGPLLALLLPLPAALVLRRRRRRATADEVAREPGTDQGLSLFRE